MLEWTGERFVPWAREAAVAYEHLHRYAWASERVLGKSVADLASGEGYGAALLASHAASVVAVEIDGPSIAHAAGKYRIPNLRFVQASILQVPLASHAVDAIVCFEAIEHIEEHDELLAEVKRLLKPDGLFLASTPNKALYRSDKESNPFHVRELSFEEFDSLLGRSFKHRRYFNQRVLTASSIWQSEASNGPLVREFRVARHGSEFQPVAGESAGVYLIALASDSEQAISAPGISGSVMIDHSNEFFEATARRNDEHIRALDQGIEWLKKNARELEEALALQSERLNEANLERGRMGQELLEIRQSRGWRLVLKARQVRDLLFGK